MGFPTKNDQHLGCEMVVAPFKETPICHQPRFQLKKGGPMEPFQNSLPNLEVDWSCEVVKSFDQIYGRPYDGTLGTWWKVFISFLNSQNWSLVISYSVGLWLDTCLFWVPF